MAANGSVRARPRTAVATALGETPACRWPPSSTLASGSANTSRAAAAVTEATATGMTAARSSAGTRPRERSERRWARK
jgi:hypothetical protein